MSTRALYEAMKREGAAGPLEYDYCDESTRAQMGRFVAAACGHPEFQAWHNYGSNVSRMQVKGGWLYRYDNTPHMTFVPNEKQ